jgi:putative protease
MSRSTVELLAPARDADIGIAALDHGADAVYIGGPAFGARVAAANEVADIERLCRHARRYRARIFVTLNTILRDDELEAAVRVARQVHEAGADALIVQDMALAQLQHEGVLAPIQLHASTQCDIRTPAKAAFLARAGFAQLVLARELDLGQIAAVAAAVGERAVLEYFVHGALCVAYSGQCYLSHAHTGRSANRGDCSQACRLPYTVTDAAGRVIAHDKHVLSMKDNNQSAQLEALVDAGIRSFKIEGRYKDLGYVKNVTAHYRLLLDALLERRGDLRRASDGRVALGFTPDVERNFQRGFTDYFTTGRQADPQAIVALDTPKHAGPPVAEVLRVTAQAIEVRATTALANGDGLAYFDLQRQLVGLHVNRVEPLAGADGLLRLVPREPVAGFKDLRPGTVLHRNRDQAWDRLLARPDSARRRIGVAARLDIGFDAAAAGGRARLALALRDEAGIDAQAERVLEGIAPAHDAARARAALHAAVGKLGDTEFELQSLEITGASAGFPHITAAQANGLRRAAVAALQQARAAAHPRWLPAVADTPLPRYPESSLSYLANVFNQHAYAFYRRAGVEVVASAYEAHEERGDVSLMITKHCVRWTMSLCPKQAKGVTGVQGTIRAEPLALVHGGERLELRFDCKPCEMHVVGRLKPVVARAQAQALRAQPLVFYRQRPAGAPAPHAAPARQASPETAPS